MNVFEIIIVSSLGIFVSIVCVIAILHIISIFSKSTWFCHKMGWHKAPYSIGFDGCSATGTCPRCNKEVLCDSQGNWF